MIEPTHAAPDLGAQDHDGATVEMIPVAAMAAEDHQRA